MMDVTDRMGPPSRYRAPVREGSGLSGSSSIGSTAIKDIRTILSETEPLSGVLTPREVDEIMQTTAKIVGDTNVEWTKRLNMVSVWMKIMFSRREFWRKSLHLQLKTFRSLCCDPTHHAQIVAYLRHLGPPLQAAVKDLRSQLGREACITVAHLAQQLGTKAEFLVEPMLPTLFTLLVANAKVVSITGSATITVVYESIPSWRLLPPLQTQMASKSKEVRRAICSCMKIVLHQWPPPTIQKHAHIIHEVMKKVSYLEAEFSSMKVAELFFSVITL